MRRERIGDDDLLEQPDEEQEQRVGHVAVAEDLVPHARELGHHLLVMDDGARQEMGKEGDEERIIQEVVFLGPARVGVDEIGDLGERKEADAQRQDDLLQRQVEAGKRC